MKRLTLSEMFSYKVFFLLDMLIILITCKAHAYDITVVNEDGVTIYYNYINEKKELEVTTQTSDVGSGYKSLTKLRIPETATYMGRARKVTSIGENTFSGCSGLTSVEIPSSVTSIGVYAFKNCSGLQKVIVKDIAAWCKIRIESFDANPLYYAHHLYSDEYTEIKKLAIPNSVMSIGTNAFWGCSDLTSVTIPNSVTSIGDNAFFECSSLTSVEIPNSVKSIGTNAFYRCSSLTSVTIGNSVTSIGGSAFEGCKGLTSIEIPNSVTSIGDAAFLYCTGLASVTINSNAILSKNYTSSKSLINIFGQLVKEYIIGNSVTSIGSYAFNSCSNLTSVEIGNSVTSIGDAAFAKSGLTSVEIPNSVTSIGDSAFYDCFLSNSVTIGNNVTSIGDYAFSRTDMTSIKIPNSVTSIGKSAFEYCSRLTSVEIGNSVTSIGYYAFYRCTGLKKVIVKDIAAWCRINFLVYDNPLFYAKHIYSDENTEITNLVIPNSVTSIGSYAFINCNELTSVEIPNSVTSIGSSAFSGCSGLTSVEIGNSVTSIGYYAFKNCSGLQKVIVKDIAAWCKIRIESFDANPLWYAHHLYSDENTEIVDLKIPNGMTRIMSCTFSGCFDLTSVEIPDGVVEIGYEAFKGCSHLTSVTIPNSVTSIKSDAFDFVNEKEMVHIYSYIIEPTKDTGSSFSDGIYDNATLHIPEGTLEKHKAVEGWKKFLWIEEDIPSGIKAIENETLIIDDATNECYTLDGRRLSSKPTKRGIYIVNGRKIVVK